MTALPRGGRLAAIVFAALLSGVLVIAAAASAATRATVTASAAKARGCHTHFVGNRAHTDVLRVRSNVEGLLRAYKQVKIGDPMEEGTLMGPLVNRRAVNDMMDGMRRIRRFRGGAGLVGRGVDSAHKVSFDRHQTTSGAAESPVCLSSFRRVCDGCGRRGESEPREWTSVRLVTPGPE